MQKWFSAYAIVYASASVWVRVGDGCWWINSPKMVRNKISAVARHTHTRRMPLNLTETKNYLFILDTHRTTHTRRQNYRIIAMPAQKLRENLCRWQNHTNASRQQRPGDRGAEETTGKKVGKIKFNWRKKGRPRAKAKHHRCIEHNLSSRKAHLNAHATSHKPARARSIQHSFVSYFGVFFGFFILLMPKPLCARSVGVLVIPTTSV